jgi:hypothetical protein
MAPKPDKPLKPGKRPDRLTREELAAQYGFALKVIYSVPELTQLFKRAVNAREGQYTTQRFQAELQNSQWYQNNDKFFRAAWTAENLGGADWQSSLETARLAVADAARKVGADVSSEELETLSRRYLYEGWGDASRAGLLQDALSQEIAVFPSGGSFRGAAGNFVDNLKSVAFSNGLRYNDDWYLSAARSVARGDTTEQDWGREIRKQAAGMYPLYSDQINAGMNAYDIASPYITVLSQTFGYSPYDITLDNSDIRKAMMNGTNLFDFQMELRQKPEWMKTKEAEDKVASTSTEIMRMFGLRG